MLRTDFGSAALPWDAATTYAAGDYIKIDKDWWISNENNNLGNNPAVDSGHWDYVNQYAPFGWRALIDEVDPQRDSTLRAIGVYAEAECINLLYTSENFKFVREAGKYLVDSPVGRRTASAVPVYYALLWGSLIEGVGTLTGDLNVSSHYAFTPGMSIFEVNQRGGEVVIEPPEIFSPEGHRVVSLYMDIVNRLYLGLENEERDNDAPTLTFHLPSGDVEIPMVWRQSRRMYRSVMLPEARLRLLAIAGGFIGVDVTWN